MAQYEKLINLSLLNQFLTKAKTIFAPKITASGILKGDGNGGVSAATAGTDYATPALVKVSDTQPTEAENKLWVDTDAGSGNNYQVPTVAESLAMGVSGAKVGDLVRVNSVDANGKPTSWRKAPLCEITTNPNLLDNWYFVGGGSQLGDGVFPINQRGQTTYSGDVYGIDRWRGNQSSVNIAITSDGINITRSSGAYHSLNQKINNPESLRGKKVTLSLLATGYNRIRIVANNVNIADSGGLYGNELNSVSAVIPNDTTELFVSIYTSYEITTVAKAVKLELGSEQTLAHNEGTEQNPIWVLNELPDYGEELEKCKRYFERISGAYSVIGTGFTINHTMGICVAFVKPKIKTVGIVSETSINGTIYYNDATHLGNNAIAGTSFSNLTCNSDGRLQVTFRGFNGLTTGTNCLFTFRDATSYFDISAEP